MNYYEEIKKELIDNELNKKVKDYSKNKYELQKYYNVGKLLFDAGKHYGDGIIKDYSQKLTVELGKGYTFTALTRMRKFYNLIEKVATLSQQLTYGHYVELLPYKDLNKINYYIKIIEEYNLSIRQLRQRIRSNEYERLPEDTKKNFSIDFKPKKDDYIKNPILIKNNNNSVIISEKVLQKLILEDISSFLEELGVGDRYNYIDLFLYNIKYKCYVVIELKITELRKEHIGQIETYMNYIDKNIKMINDDKTIGIIICKKDKQSLTKRNHLLKQQIYFV